MKILYIHYKEPSHRPSGMEVHIASSTAAIRSLGHDVRVLPMLGDSRTATRAETRRQRGLLRRQLGRFGYAPRCICLYFARWLKLYHAVRSYKPDVLVVRYAVFMWSDLILAKILRLPIVYEVNSTSFETRSWKSSEVYVYPFTAFLERRLFRASDGLLAISENLHAALAGSGVPDRLITTNPNGADPDRFRPALPGNDLRARLGLDGAVVVGFLGSFARWHDVSTLIAIVPGILQRNPHVKFLFAGGDLGRMAPEARAALEGLKDRVVFTSSFPIAQAPAYLDAMDIVLTLYPRFEPFYFSPVKLFEYMAAGKAIVATAIGQQSDVIQDGVNGLLVAPGDAPGVQQKVQLLIEDPGLRRRLGEEARRCLVARYTWRHNAERMLQVCERAVLAKGRSRAGVAGSA